MPGEDISTAVGHVLRQPITEPVTPPSKPAKTYAGLHETTTAAHILHLVERLETSDPKVADLRKKLHDAALALYQHGGGKAAKFKSTLD